MENSDGLPTDGRSKFDYKTKYPEETCQKKIKKEALYISVLLVLSMIFMLLNFLGFFENILKLQGERAIIFHKVGYCVISGLLGSATLGIKYFYRVVARGIWNEDRVYWRLFSPLIAASLAIAMSAIMIKDVNYSSSMAITIGFLTGYFSDEAVGKMHDVACVLFSKTEKNHENNR